jgi:hypothetical protein
MVRSILFPLSLLRKVREELAASDSRNDCWEIDLAVQTLLLHPAQVGAMQNGCSMIGFQSFLQYPVGRLKKTNRLPSHCWMKPVSRIFHFPPAGKTYHLGKPVLL